MTKNIVLCSDGTGNQGGFGKDSNVFKLYQAVSLHTGKPNQIKFYDNGVGTQTNKYISAVSGAFGFGFQQNVRDLYEFLVRTYEPGDNIYLFGFSRGAATVRSFASMLHYCGLLNRKDENGDWKSAERIQKLIDQAIECYRGITETGV